MVMAWTRTRTRLHRLIRRQQPMPLLQVNFNYWTSPALCILRCASPAFDLSWHAFVLCPCTGNTQNKTAALGQIRATSVQEVGADGMVTIPAGKLLRWSSSVMKLLDTVCCMYVCKSNSCIEFDIIRIEAGRYFWLQVRWWWSCVHTNCAWRKAGRKHHAQRWIKLWIV